MEALGVHQDRSHELVWAVRSWRAGIGHQDQREGTRTQTSPRQFVLWLGTVSVVRLPNRKRPQALTCPM